MEKNGSTRPHPPPPARARAFRPTVPPPPNRLLASTEANQKPASSWYACRGQSGVPFAVKKALVDERKYATPREQTSRKKRKRRKQKKTPPVLLLIHGAARCSSLNLIPLRSRLPPSDPVKRNARTQKHADKRTHNSHERYKHQMKQSQEIKAPAAVGKTLASGNTSHHQDCLIPDGATPLPPESYNEERTPSDQNERRMHVL